MLLAMTIPPEALMPWKRRERLKRCTLGESMQRMVVRIKRASVIKRTFLLPKRSLTGPMNSCPVAKPSMLMVRLICTRASGDLK